LIFSLAWKGSPVMLSKDKSLQHKFLKTSVQEQAPVTVFLVNGVKLQGVIAEFDHFLGGHPKPAIGGHLKSGQRDS
jgi:Hfq protein